MRAILTTFVRSIDILPVFLVLPIIRRSKYSIIRVVGAFVNPNPETGDIILCFIF